MKNNFTTSQKYQARVDTYNEYKSISNRSYLPSNKELWTLCADCYNPITNSILESSELDYVLKEGFISSPNQFHGIEKNDIIHLNNMKLLVGNFYHGKFHKVFQDNAKNPGLVNVDTMSTYPKFRNHFEQILDWASQWDDIVCIFNFVSEMNYRGINCKFNDIIENMKRDGIGHIIEKWQFHDRYYEYDGKRGQTKMITMWFYK